MVEKALLLLLFTAWALAFSKPPGPQSTTPPGEFGSYTLQEIVDRLVASEDIFAQAVVASNLYDELIPERYPSMLVYVGANNGMERYLLRQGLTKKEFLTHPKLRSFMESHFIVEFVNTIEIRQTRHFKRTYTTANGSKVVLTTGDNLDPGRGRVMFANGVPVNPQCLVSGSNFDGDQLLKTDGQLCNADAPVVKDFDWSE